MHLFVARRRQIFEWQDMRDNLGFVGRAQCHHGVTASLALSISSSSWGGVDFSYYVEVVFEAGKNKSP